MNGNVTHSRTAGRWGEIEWVRAGVDWLSASLPRGSKGEEEWKLACVHVLSAISDNGYETQVRPLNGYRGLMAGGSFWGERHDGQYIQLAGIAAQQHFDAVARSDLSVSRIDLAVTVRYRARQVNVGAEALQDAIKSAQTLPSGRSRRVWYMSGNDGGFTLYIGAPTSRQRGRLYNKEVQSKTAEYENCWRWEVVYKDDLAVQVYYELMHRHIVHRPWFVAQLVANWYLQRGVAVDWRNTPNDVVQPIARGLPSDADKRLRWLRSQVRPAIKWLWEHGYVRELFEALDLGDFSPEENYSSGGNE